MFMKNMSMSEYNFLEIESKWQKYWADNQTFKAINPLEGDALLQPKYYVLDMFPYPSGAGLHVGHPLGYIASDIYSRYKRHKGFNVLHPMGYDSFGLPAEQYAIQTGQHPEATTQENIAMYREQLDKIGFSFDWSREVQTSDPSYFKWTQWIFLELFHSWYDRAADKARSIEDLLAIFKAEGNQKVEAVCDEDALSFSAEDWNSFSDIKKQEILLSYRMAYLADTEVNWCAALGTVLANDEIINGLSERGGHPVVRKKMRQWSMRIAAYAERFLEGLEGLDWPQPLKDFQTNWIGKSQGASVLFSVKGDEDQKIEVFTTRADTIYGVSFVCLAPELDLVAKLTTPEQKAEVEAYQEEASAKSERDRQANVKNITGVFTGSYAVHPLTGKELPIWIADYVLSGYGTGAVMSVPCGDSRDYAFAKHFGIEIPNIFKDKDISEEPHTNKENTFLANSDIYSDLSVEEAAKAIIEKLVALGVGEAKTTYRLRNAVFSRQRYWGEPFPVYYKDGLPQTIDIKHLPLALPEVELYLPTEDGAPPLGRADVWAWDTENNKTVASDKVNNTTIFPLELNTMPGWAGSSWYLFRYMDAENQNEFAAKEALDYWGNVDLYIGGSEHAGGHLIYSRFWTKFLYDRGFINVKEPFQKLINQGMILGESALVRLLNLKFENASLSFAISASDYEKLESGKAEEIDLSVYQNHIDFPSNVNWETLDKTSLSITNTRRIHVLVDYVNNDNVLDIEGTRLWSTDFKQVLFLLDANGKYIVDREVDKMSKSKFNVVNPDVICKEYGADTLRMYEMFLGPLEHEKPWNTAGISGVHGFLKRFWRLFHTGENASVLITDKPADAESLKTLHRTIKKVEEDMSHFSFNTSISTFMIAVNELTAQKCNSREVLEALTILLSPYAPHIAEELWQRLGHTESISTAAFPVFDPSALVEQEKEYPISFNGKMRFKLLLDADLTKEEIEEAVMKHDKTQAELKGRVPKRVIVVPGKIVNIVG